MTSGSRWVRLLAVVLITSASGGLIYGIEMTLNDLNWRGRGGYSAMLGGSLIFFVWLLPVSSIATFVTDRGLALVRSGSSFASVAAGIAMGAVLEAGGFGLLMLAGGSGPFPLSDLIPAAVAGAVLGALLVLLTQSSRSRELA